MKPRRSLPITPTALRLARGAVRRLLRAAIGVCLTGDLGGMAGVDALPAWDSMRHFGSRVV